jgi:DNA-binding transcriptional ArsR family regulator
MARDACQLARVLKVLSVGARVRIVQLLKDGPLCVNALASRLNITQGAVSQHLRLMRDAGLVTDQRRGYRVHYRLNQRTLTVWRDAVAHLLGSATRPRRRMKGVKQCAMQRAKAAAANRRT